MSAATTSCAVNTASASKASAAPGEVIVEAADETLLVEIGRPGPDNFMVLGYAFFAAFHIAAFVWLWYAVSHTDVHWGWALVANVGASLLTWLWTARTFNRTTIHLTRERGFIDYRPFGFRWSFTTRRVAATIGIRHFEGTDAPVVDLSFDRKSIVLEMMGHSIENLRWLCDVFNLWARGEMKSGTYRR